MASGCLRPRRQALTLNLSRQFFLSTGRNTSCILKRPFRADFHVPWDQIPALAVLRAG
jgi:hypothetical protein